MSRWKHPLLIFFASSPLFGPAVQTTTILTASPNPAFLGTPITLTATIQPSSAPGQVTFYNGPTALGYGHLIQRNCNAPGHVSGRRCLFASGLLWRRNGLRLSDDDCL
jgi:hypothetical protein